MDVTKNMNMLSSLLGIDQTRSAQKTQQTGTAATKSTGSSSQYDGDLASVSAAAGSLASSDTSDVRMDKVAPIQAALAAGTYSVSASAVAGKLVSSMLGE